MANRLATMKNGDDVALQEVGKRLNIELNHKEVWREAQDYYDETGNSSAEVQIKGLDYVVVEK